MLTILTLVRACVTDWSKPNFRLDLTEPPDWTGWLWIHNEDGGGQPPPCKLMTFFAFYHCASWRSKFLSHDLFFAFHYIFLRSIAQFYSLKNCSYNLLGLQCICPFLLIIVGEGPEGGHFSLFLNFFIIANLSIFFLRRGRGHSPMPPLPSCQCHITSDTATWKNEQPM